VRAARKYNPGFIEMRIDYLRESLESKERRESISKLFDGREILTLRSRAQGGKFSGEESLRVELIQDFVEECKPKFVDVELSSLVASKKLKSVLAKASGTTRVIASRHFFNDTPAPSMLERIAGNAPDFVYATKIACKARNLGDNFKVLSLYDTQKPEKGKSKRLIAFCMGPLGVFSRIACVSLGSPLTYASLPNETIAPGQLDALTMNQLLAKI